MFRRPGARRDVASDAYQDVLRRKASALYVVLTPDLEIVDASDAYLRATFLRRDDVRGCKMFDVFPDNPNHPTADGVRRLHASLDRVLQHARPDRMPVQRYDVRDRLGSDGVWVEKFWAPVNTPLFGRGTHEVTHILHEVEDVSDVVALRTQLDEQRLIIAEERASLSRMRREVQRREEELRAIDRRLAVLLTGAEPPESFVESVREHLGLRETRRYWSPGERAPETRAYSALHGRACDLGPQSLYVAAGGAFPRCPRCGDAVLYRVRDDSRASRR